MIMWLYFLKVEWGIKVQRMMPKEKQPQYSAPHHPRTTSILSIWFLLYGWKKQIICFVEKEGILLHIVFVTRRHLTLLRFDTNEIWSWTKETATIWRHTHTVKRNKFTFPLNLRKNDDKNQRSWSHQLFLSLHILTLDGIYWLWHEKNQNWSIYFSFLLPSRIAPGNHF